MAGGTMQVEGRTVESSESVPSSDDYTVVNGCRLVKPYHFDFMCTVRQRWLGQSIIDIFVREFPARNREYYLQALADGRLRVEGMQVGPSTPLGDGMRMRHFIHRHEPPVPAAPIPVVGLTPDVVAVCKPHGTPVHVAGQYRKNTVQSILAAERPDLGPLLPIHRLDKPVSGLLLFARNKAAANVLRQQIEERDVEKVYVARVEGAFPESSRQQPIVVDVPLAWDPRNNQATAVPAAAEELRRQAESPEAQAAAAAGAGDGDAEGQQQLQQPGRGTNDAAGQQAHWQELQRGQAEGDAEVGDAAASVTAEATEAAEGDDPANGSNKRNWKKQRQEKYARKQAKRQAEAAKRAAAAAAGTLGAKPAVTEYRLLAVAPDGKTSLVECRPRTGRTHQIRVHLQYIGHPIANDNQYGGSYPGPMSCRSMAQQLGVAWEADASPSLAAAAAAAAEGNAATGGAGLGAEQAEAAGSSKRQRLEQEQQQASLADEELEAATSVEQQQQPCGIQPAAGTEPKAAAAAAAAPAVPAPVQRASGAGATDGVCIWELNDAFRSAPEFEAPAELHESLCIHCPYFAPRDYPADLRPLWLHAKSYSCREWSYGTELPDWADAGYVPALE